MGVAAHVGVSKGLDLVRRVVYALEKFEGETNQSLWYYELE